MPSRVLVVCLHCFFFLPNVALRRCKRSVDRSAPSPRLCTAKPAARRLTARRHLPRRPRRATRWRGRLGQVASLATVALGGAARRGGARRPSSLHPRHARRTAVAAADGCQRPSDFRLHSCVVVEQPPPPSRGAWCSRGCACGGRGSPRSCRVPSHHPSGGSQPDPPPARAVGVLDGHFARSARLVR